ncbi:hypothetical protein WA1_20235 [Scytonema hofmannii PCC 7110]|uniref:UDP-N-acetylglucosamine kinase n=1 Tax=Scytonema hofmannii PCC 7110 TaxID=128403 RepID=A0A139XCA1_9CYAN|nr:zeta toxin family protein [Scytonema hofmannii]KYC42305.1 hypothetical protein WA1_20235 [Scytonema hofmannii PCC 7110]
MRQPNSQPKLVVFAGPNGSGKSTITNILRETANFPANYINPDEIALTLRENNPNRKAYQAAQIAEELRQSYIDQRESFAFETVMSHPSKLKLMKQALMSGYQVELVFVATSNPEININRVRQRVAEGGHDVPADKIRERYNRTIELLPAAVEIANRVRIYDNSTIPQQAVVIENGQITYQSEEIPNWVQTTLTKLEERASERSDIATNFPTTSANIDGGKYVGTVSQTTDNYIVQQTGDSRILHDRSIVKGEFETGDNIRIAYRDGNVAATVQPTQENQQWAESILPIATNILQVERQENRVENPSRGIELVRGNNYQLQLNRNNETLTISSVADNRTVASYDLAESTVIAANPTVQDKQYWLSRSQ